MCRWLAYYGDKPIRMDKVLYGPQHSLIQQSLSSTMGAEPTNGDGFGIGWYSASGEPGIFKSMEPAWNDRNLRELAAHVESPLFIAHVRATTERRCSRRTAIRSAGASGCGCTTG